MRTKLGMIKKYICYKTKKTDLPFYPDRIYLELTNHCNFQCIMCPNGKGLMKREKGYMDYDLAKNIIDEMAPRADTIVLHIWGESLYHPRIFDIIKYCQKYNVRTELSTNTSLLNEKISRDIIDSGLSTIYLCIDGATKETYEKVRKNGDYESAIKNVEDFLRIKNEENKNKNKKRPLVNIQIIVMKETKDEIDIFRRKWSVEGVDKINVKTLDTWGGQVPEISDLAVSVNSLAVREKDNPINRFHCPNLWYHVHIYYDGSVVCCDRDFDARYPLGNVKGGVMKIWNGPKMQELRRKHIEKDLVDIPSCGNCNEWCWWQPTLLSSWGNIPKE